MKNKNPSEKTQNQKITLDKSKTQYLVPQFACALYVVV